MITLRPITPNDNAAMADIIRSVLPEFGCVGPGYASGDAETDDLYTAYNQPRSQYWVAVQTPTDGGELILGGSGYAQLLGTTADQGICELRKLYLRPQVRRLGIGKQLLELCIQEAAKDGYRLMYLESVPAMAAAIQLYKAYGFEPVDTHLGNTGHQKNCSVYMVRALEPAGIKV